MHFITQVFDKNVELLTIHWFLNFESVNIIQRIIMMELDLQETDFKLILSCKKLICLVEHLHSWLHLEELNKLVDKEV